MPGYFAVLTFDIHAGDSVDYECINRELNNLGYSKQLWMDQELDDLPQNTYLTRFLSDRSVEETLEFKMSEIKSKFTKCATSAKLFLALAGSGGNAIEDEVIVQE